MTGFPRLLLVPEEEKRRGSRGEELLFEGEKGEAQRVFLAVLVTPDLGCKIYCSEVANPRISSSPSLPLPLRTLLLVHSLKILLMEEIDMVVCECEWFVHSKECC